jgi:hypothetical protein
VIGEGINSVTGKDGSGTGDCVAGLQGESTCVCNYHALSKGINHKNHLWSLKRLHLFNSAPLLLFVNLLTSFSITQFGVHE